MKLKLKLIATAAAMVSLAGTAQADLTSGGTVQNGSMTLTAWNTVTGAWYIRDLGYFINDFMPTSVTTAAGDGSLVGNKTPEAGLTIDKTVKSSFEDAAFGTWYATQPAADVRWIVGSYDNSQGTPANFRRMIISTTVSETFTNTNVDNFTATGNYGGLSSFFGSATLSANNTTVGINTGIANAGFGAAVLGQTVGNSSNLYYVARSAVGTGGGNPAATTQYGNSENFASITLFANGDLVYSLAPAAVGEVPLPGAFWLMGAGLVGVGGMIRRRRAAALA